MAYKGPEITLTPPKWSTVEDLRDNLVEYMMLQSPYKELSNEDMPDAMVTQMEKSMTRLALAIFHEINSSGRWTVAVEGETKEEINEGNNIVNFKGIDGIEITYEDSEGGLTLIFGMKKEEVEEIVQEIVETIVPPIVEQIVEPIPPIIPEPVEVLYYFVAISVGQDYNQGNENFENYTSGSVSLSSPTLAGNNYVFLSVPTYKGKPKILNSINKDISYQFSSAGVDQRDGYQENTIWKRGSTFVTTLSTTFTLIM